MFWKDEKTDVEDGRNTGARTPKRHNKRGRVEQIKLSRAEQVRKVAMTPSQALQRPSPASQNSLASKFSRLALGRVPAFKNLEGHVRFGGQLANELGRLNSAAGRISLGQRIVPCDAQSSIVHRPLCSVLQRVEGAWAC